MFDISKGTDWISGDSFSKHRQLRCWRGRGRQWRWRWQKCRRKRHSPELPWIPQRNSIDFFYNHYPQFPCLYPGKHITIHGIPSLIKLHNRIFAVLISAFKQWNYYCCKWEWWKEFVYWPMKIKYFQVLNKRQTEGIKILFSHQINSFSLFSNECIMIMIEKIHKYNRNGT